MAYTLKHPCAYPKRYDQTTKEIFDCGAPAGQPGGYKAGGRPSFWCQPCTDHYNDHMAAALAERRARQALAEGEVPF